MLFPQSKFVAIRLACSLFAMLFPAFSVNCVVAQSLDNNEITAEAIEPDQENSLPAWIDKGTYRDEHGNDFVLVESDAEDKEQTLATKTPARLTDALRQHVQKQLDSGAAQSLKFDPRTVVSDYAIPDRTYVATKNFDSVGPMFVRYDQLKITPAQRAEITERWTRTKSRFRLMQTGLLGAGFLSLLLILFSYFRVNHATRGLHAGRLQFFCGLAILTLVAVGFYAGKFLPWY